MRVFLSCITALACVATVTAAVSVLVHNSVTTTDDAFDNYGETVTMTSWNNFDWEDATVADFEAFDLIFIGSTFSARPSTVHANNGTMSLAAKGRLVVSNLQYELCQTSTGEYCNQLYAAMDWVRENPNTGLIASGQILSSAADWLPSDAHWSGVAYGDTAYDANILEVTDSSHPIMSGVSDDDLSNWVHSAHATFSGVGSFSTIAKVCSATGYLPTGNDPATECSGTMKSGVITYDPPQWYCRSPGATSGSYKIDKCSEACGAATFITVRCCEGNAFEDDGKCKNDEKVTASTCLATKPVCP